MRMKKQRMDLRRSIVALVSACALCACGQKGALYLPDHTPQPVIAPPAAPAAPAATSITPAAPASDPTAAPSPDTATSPDTTTRKVPRDPDPTTAR